MFAEELIPLNSFYNRCKLFRSTIKLFPIGQQVRSSDSLHDVSILCLHITHHVRDLDYFS